MDHFTTEQPQRAMTFQEQGFRFCCNPAPLEFRWIDPVQLKLFYAHWIDVTDLSDEDFDAFVARLQTNHG